MVGRRMGQDRNWNDTIGLGKDMADQGRTIQLDDIRNKQDFMRYEKKIKIKYNEM